MDIQKADNEWNVILLRYFNPIGAHKDRHENIGYGYIGFETLNKYIHHPLLNGIPKIIETPYINEKPPYKQEIQMFKDGKYVEGWREKDF